MHADTDIGLGDLLVRYRAQGEGAVVVLVHGLGQDHQMWSGIQAALPDFRTIAYDLRGHGGSSLGSANGSMAQLAEDLIAALQQWGPATVVGFSLGGSIALWAASERPDLVTGVIAVATSSVVGSAAASSLADRIEIFESGDASQMRQIVLADTQAQLAGADVDPELVTRQRLAAIGDGSGYVNGARAVISMRTDRLQDRLVRISAPVLVVSGEVDPWCPRRAADIMRDELPHSDFVEMTGVGHLVTDVAEADLSRIIRTHLEENPHD